MITGCTISIPVIPNAESNPMHLGISHYIRDDEEYHHSVSPEVPYILEQFEYAENVTILKKYVANTLQKNKEIFYLS